MPPPPTAPPIPSVPSTSIPVPLPLPSSFPHAFQSRKALILAQLAVPATHYDDRSPKGSLDAGVRDLVSRVNARDGWVTTSSCAGRVCVFVEGERRQRRTGAGKGDGGEEEEEEEEELLGEGRGGEKGRGWEEEEEEGKLGEEGTGGEDGQLGDEGRGGEDEEDDGDGDSAPGGGEWTTGRRRPGKGRGKGRVKMKMAGAGGKGGGGRWLFVSHEGVDMEDVKRVGVLSFLGLQRGGEGAGSESESESERQFTEERLIHFKFEPMILHILTASLSHAQTILRAAIQAGFRESGALNLTSTTSEAPTPMVAVRTTGLALDSVIGSLDINGQGIPMVSNQFLEGLLAIANERFEENSRRITRFCDLLLGSVLISADVDGGKKSRGSDWEDTTVRRERKRAEGLQRSQELREHRSERDA